MTPVTPTTTIAPPQMTRNALGLSGVRMAATVMETIPMTKTVVISFMPGDTRPGPGILTTARWCSSVARLPHKQEVGGSSPSRASEGQWCKGRT